MKLLIADFGAFLLKHTSLKQTGRVLFYYGEDEFVTRDLMDLYKSFENMKKVLTRSVRKSDLPVIRESRDSVEESLESKLHDIERGEKTGDYHLCHTRRCPKYLDVIALEKAILQWMDKKIAAVEKRGLKSARSDS